MDEDVDDARVSHIHETKQQVDGPHHLVTPEQTAALDENMWQEQDNEGGNVEGDDDREEEDELDEDDVSVEEESEENEEEDEEGNDGEYDTEDDECGKEVVQHEREHDKKKQDSEQNVLFEEDLWNVTHEVHSFGGIGETASPATGILSIPTLLSIPTSPGGAQFEQEMLAPRSVKQKARRVAVVNGRPTTRDDWSELATHALLKRWGEKYMQLNKGKLKREDWEEVALAVREFSKIPKSEVQCKNRLDTLKKKYKLEKQKQSATVDSRWPFYKQLDDLLGVPVKYTSVPGAVDAGKVVEGRFDRSRKSDKKNTKSLPDDDSTTSRFKGSPDMTFCSSDHDAAGSGGMQSRGRKRKVADGAPLRTLAKAITKFGEIYKKVESAKQQQLMDLEKIRMDFTRELEMHRIQLVMQTQVEVAKMRRGATDEDATASNLSG